MDGISGVSAMSGGGYNMTDTNTIVRDMNRCIDKWDLKHLGWRGFEKLDWVTDITNKYPECEHIAHTCSCFNPGYLDDVQDLMDGAASKEDKKGIHNYFMGKLGLEELSCRMNGAGSGNCDKRTAFFEICRMTHEMVKQ